MTTPHSAPTAGPTPGAGQPPDIVAADDNGARATELGGEAVAEPAAPAAVAAAPEPTIGPDGSQYPASRSRETGARVARDRRGRGLRTPLLPAHLPGARTRSQQFDDAVLEATADLEERWPREMAAIDFAVDEVPPVPDGGVLPSTDVVVDGGVPLTRFVPPGVDARGRATRARIVIYRRPVEVRAESAGDLGDLVAQVLTEQISAVLGENSGDSDQ